MNDTAARKVTIRNLFRAYPSSVNADMATLEIYVAATAELSIEAITRSVEQFVTGKVERENRSFVPSADEFAGNARVWQAAIQRKSELDGPTLHTGMMSIDYGRGSINMRGLTADEQDRVMQAKGITSDGASMPGMSLDQIKAEVSGLSIENNQGKAFAIPGRRME